LGRGALSNSRRKKRNDSLGDSIEEGWRNNKEERRAKKYKSKKKADACKVQLTRLKRVAQRLLDKRSGKPIRRVEISSQKAGDRNVRRNTLSEEEKKKDN